MFNKVNVCLNNIVVRRCVTFSFGTLFNHYKGVGTQSAHWSGLRLLIHFSKQCKNGTKKKKKKTGSHDTEADFQRVTCSFSCATFLHCFLKCMRSCQHARLAAILKLLIYRFTAVAIFTTDRVVAQHRLDAKVILAQFCTSYRWPSAKRQTNVSVEKLGMTSQHSSCLHSSYKSPASRSFRDVLSSLADFGCFMPFLSIMRQWRFTNCCWSKHDKCSISKVCTEWGSSIMATRRCIAGWLWCSLLLNTMSQVRLLRSRWRGRVLTAVMRRLKKNLSVPRFLHRSISKLMWSGCSVKFVCFIVFCHSFHFTLPDSFYA